MKNLCELITCLAVAAFMLALCTMESNPVLSFLTIFIAGTWIVCYSWMAEEKRRKSERRW